MTLERCSSPLEICLTFADEVSARNARSRMWDLFLELGLKFEDSQRPSVEAPAWRFLLDVNGAFNTKQLECVFDALARHHSGRCLLKRLEPIGEACL